jgi:hypothetical protein
MNDKERGEGKSESKRSFSAMTSVTKELGICLLGQTYRKEVITYQYRTK